MRFRNEHQRRGSIFVIGQQFNYHRARFRQSYGQLYYPRPPVMFTSQQRVCHLVVYLAIYTGYRYQAKMAMKPEGWTAFSNGRFWGPMESAWSTCGVPAATATSRVTNKVVQPPTLTTTMTAMKEPLLLSPISNSELPDRDD